MIRLVIDIFIILILSLYTLSSVQIMRAEQWVLAGERAGKKNDPKKAIEYYQKAADLVPESGRYWRKLAKAAMAVSYREGGGKRALYQAYNACQHVTANDPLYPYGWFDTGRVLWALSALGVDDMPDPEPYFLHALEIDPDNPLFLEGMVRWLIERGEEEKARLIFYRLGNFRADIIDSLAPLLLKTDEQRNDFGKMLTNPRAQVMYALYLMRWGMRDLAAIQIESITPQALKRPDIAYFAGRVLIDLNRRDQAKQIISAALEKNPDYALLVNMLAGIYRHNQQYDEAIDVYKRALKSDPKLWEMNITIAKTATEKGDLDLAVSFYQKALDAGKDGKKTIKEIHVAIADIYRRKNDLNSAIIHYKLALEQDQEDRDLQFQIKKLQVEMELRSNAH